MPAFAPEPFTQPAVSPETASLFRRAPYISLSEFQQTPTAVAVKNLVPSGNQKEQEASLAAVIARASDLVDTICFHRPDGTLAASPSTESAWIRPKDDGSLLMICNFKPILEVSGLAVGVNPSEMGNIGQSAAETLTIQGRVIMLPGNINRGNLNTFFPAPPLRGGKAYVVWVYVNGFPHTSLAKAVEAEAEVIEIAPSTPGGSQVYGVYPGTLLTIHDGANTESVVVSSVEGLKLNLTAELLYEHKLPSAPDSTIVSAVPWDAEQACIFLTSYLIKTRGSRAMTFPQSPKSGSKTPPKQADGQAGSQKDYETAVEFLKHYTVPVLRST